MNFCQDSTKQDPCGPFFFNWLLVVGKILWGKFMMEITAGLRTESDARPQCVSSRCCKRKDW